MPPVRSIINQYRGVNAHLHSRWQAEGGWNNFHNRHLGDITGLLRPLLLPMGYTATMEVSLQIRRLWDDMPQTPRADILISRDSSCVSSGMPSQFAVAEMTIDDLMTDVVEIEKPYRAVQIAR